MRPASRLAALAALTALAACGSDGKRVGEACGAAAECARGLVCFERACAASYPASPACSPAGTPRIVRGDPVAMTAPPPGTCLSGDRDPDPSDGIVDLGIHPVGTALTVEVPPGTSSLTLFSQEVAGSATDVITFRGFSLPNTVVPTDVLLPGGRLFFSDTDPYPTDAGGYDDVTGVLAYYGGATPISGSFTIPNTAASLDLVRTAGEVPPGTWSFTVNDWAQECLGIEGCSVPGGPSTGSYRLHAHAKPGRVASTGTLDLEVYLATDPNGRLPNAEAAVADRQVTRWVRVLSSYFSAAGICLGTVTFRDIPAWAKERYAPFGIVDISGAGLGLEPRDTPVGCDDLSQLFTVAMAPSRAVHLFLSEELDSNDDDTLGTILGIDGSIPGPSGVPGTINGGAIVALSDFFGGELVPGACDADTVGDFRCGTDILSYVAAHEAGHWLGLYHTTEWHGTTFDPLSDTGTCPCLRCAGASERRFCAERGVRDPTLMEAVFCAAASGPVFDVLSRATSDLACAGARNLMFWQFDPTFAEGQLSREQGEVMRLNPAVR